MRHLTAQVMLRIIDAKWMAHLQEMDYLKTGIGLRAIGQRDPLVEYKNEAYSAFEAMTAAMYDDFLRTILRLEVAVKLNAPEKPSEEGLQYSNPEETLAARQAPAHAAARAAVVGAVPVPKPVTGKAQTVVKDKEDPFANVGRNDPCPCGSGLKYKKCHGK